MNILIVEDENLAINKLKRILKEIDKDITYAGFCNSIQETKEWLENNPLPDLIFLDVLLNDGLSFEIFKDNPVNCPVIFITAFSEYAIKAFKLHSIDYILKPYRHTEVIAALHKFKQLKTVLTQKQHGEVFNSIEANFPKKYKSRFFVKSGNDILSIETNNIFFFSFEDQATILLENNGKKYVLNYSLDQLETVLDPRQFFRINRKFIANIKGIEKMRTYSKGAIQLNLQNCSENPLLVSKNRCKEFRLWLDN